MLETLLSFNLSQESWALAILCGILIGIAKTGLNGAAMLVVPILAGIFGSKPSVGLLLPMLCFADIFGVSYYRRHAEWYYIIRLMPWALSGIVIGLLVGAAVNEEHFKIILAVTVLAGIAIMIWRERKQGATTVPKSRWFSIIMGLAGGFTTMIGNAAGPVMALYLLSMQLPKYSYIGTTAWFFMIVNLVKVPLHVIFWHTITMRSLIFDIAMIPAIIVGAGIGITTVKNIPEQLYRKIIIAMTVLAAFKLFL
ncbi:MAG: sulfite exporter TauE/SafE family protein [Candidatus Latescibacteria bacterium]|nr:sulfite exporter TauE/SafE family protein [Candidatus Latescibacterota bacterium]